MKNVSFEKFQQLEKNSKETILQHVAETYYKKQNVSVYRAIIILQEEEGVYDSIIKEGEECFFPVGTEIVNKQYYIWCDEAGNVFEDQKYFNLKFKELIKPLEL